MDSRSLVAHRGHPAHFAENSLAGLASAVDAGARWLEIDVQASKDGTLWLFHDQETLRLTGRPGRIGDLTDERLADTRLLAPPGGETQAVARLADFGAWFASTPPEVFAFVEVKPVAVGAMSAAGALDAVLRDMAAVRSADGASRWALISFALPLLEEARERADVPIAPILAQWDDHADERLAALRPEFVFVDLKKLPSGPLPKAAWDWVVYETVDAREARRSFERGARLVETFAWPAMAAAVEHTR